MQPSVSVLMPTFQQSAFIARAVAGLLAQMLTDWELIVVDDGSRDATEAALAPFLAEPRIRLVRLPENRGLGAALNLGLELARAGLVAYLPSDDVVYPEHLASLRRLLDERPDAVLAFSGVRHHYNRIAEAEVPGFPLQLVQVMHRPTPDRWLERSELVTDDLERMMWAKLRRHGTTASTGQVTCEWVDHPRQRHKVIREPLGGVNPYRTRYRVREPLRFHSAVGNCTDEVNRYARFRERPDTPRASDGLRILLVGELAYNPERVLALEERGHRLLGLWMPDPHWYNTVGPLPFGHVGDLPGADWRAALDRERPDVIYALLNWQAVPFARAVQDEAARLGIPFVWHFKEGPFICLEKGSWAELVTLHERADGQVFCSPEMREWYETVSPGITRRSPTLVLDGDLPKHDWFGQERSPLLSDADGEVHTVVPGRPIGLHPPCVARLAAQGIHLHFYGDFTHGQWLTWIETTRELATRHLHLHGNVDQERWVEEFSRYDAGWLHVFTSANGGDLRRTGHAGLAEQDGQTGSTGLTGHNGQAGRNYPTPDLPGGRRVVGPGAGSRS